MVAEPPGPGRPRRGSRQLVTTDDQGKPQPVIFSRETWRKCADAVASDDVSLTEMGLQWRALSLQHPGRLGTYLRGFDTWLVPIRGTATRRIRDVLPLPLPTVSQEDEWWSRRDDRRWRRNKRRDWINLSRSLARQVWMWLVVAALNFEFVGRLSDDEKWCNQQLTPAQDGALEYLGEAVDYFCSDAEKTTITPEWGEFIRSKQLDYDGSEVHKALPLRWLELKPGMPPAGVAASVKVAEHVDDDIRDFLSDPEANLLPRKQWPSSVPHAKVQVEKPEDWYEIAQETYQLGILSPIRKREIFCVDGELVLNGAFAVEKKGAPLPGQIRTCRFIANQVPANSYQRGLFGDARSLANGATWSGHILENGWVILWSADDQWGAFHVGQLPRPWRSYMAFEMEVPAERVGGRLGDWTHMASDVISMGWISAVGVYQNFHRRLVFAPSPLGAALPVLAEWRRDRPFPSFWGETSSAETHQVYVDDKDQTEKVRDEEALRIVGTESAAQQDVRASYKRAGVEYVPKKSSVRVPEATRLGSHVDGVVGRSSADRDKLPLLLSLLLWLCGQRSPSEKAQQVAYGRAVHVGEYRRPLLGILNDVWRTLAGPRCYDGLPDTSTEENLCFGALLPLAFADWRASVDGRVTVSDASKEGGGACVSTGLRPLGLHLARMYEKERLHMEIPEAESMRYGPQGSIAPPGFGVSAKRQVLLVSFGDDSGVARLILGRLRVSVVGFGNCSTCADGKRLVRERWPGVFEWLEAEFVGTATLRRYWEKMGHLTSAVLIVGRLFHDGSTYMANVARRLHHRMAKIANGVPCETVLYSQCNQNEAWKEAVTRALGWGDPYLLSGEEFGSRRRCWHVWTAHQPNFFPSSGCEVENRKNYSRVTVPRVEGKMRVSGSSSIQLAEVSLGLDAEYTRVAARGSNDPATTLAKRVRLLARAPDVGPLCWVIGVACYNLRVVDRVPPPSTCLVNGLYDPQWGDAPSFASRTSPTSADEVRVVAGYVRRSDPRGSDVRLDIGVPYRSGAWPRAALPTRAWSWTVIHGYGWRDEEHINLLEFRAAFNCLKWRTRGKNGLRRRFLHLLDSQVCVSVLTRKRSSSKALQGPLRRYNALLLATGNHDFYGYANTHDNPADIPSRWHRAKGLRRKGIKLSGL